MYRRRFIVCEIHLSIDQSVFFFLFEKCRSFGHKGLKHQDESDSKGGRRGVVLCQDLAAGTHVGHDNQTLLSHRTLLKGLVDGK